MRRVIVIGGGVIGLCAAYYLNREGWEVTVADKGQLLNSCSYGNAGMIVPSHFTPLATPAMIRQSLHWIFRPESPLQIGLPSSLDLLRWEWLFLRSATNRRARAGQVPLRDLSLLSSTLYHDLDVDIEAGIHRKGILMLSATERSFEEERALAARAGELGLKTSSLTRKETEHLQGMPLDVAGAVLYQDDAHLHPGVLMRQLIAHLEGAGVTIVRGNEVRPLVFNGNQVTGMRMAGGEIRQADHYVLAAGAFSAPLASRLARHIPLAAGKGYSFAIENTTIRIPSLLSEARVAVTPFGTRTRFGGTMELGNAGTPVNMRRVRGIVHSVNRYFPELHLKLPEQREIWSGYRPCSPDGLPYIGFSRKARNLVFATGHGMLGVSLAPATGLIVSKLLSGEALPVNIDAFSPDRFSRLL